MNKYVKQLICIGLTFLTLTSYAAPNGRRNTNLGLEVEPEVSENCDIDSTECSYTPKNISQSSFRNLITGVANAIFHETNGFVLSEGYINIDPLTQSKIVYWHDEEKTRKNILRTLIRKDVLTDFTVAPGGYVDVNISIFALDTQGYDNFMFSITGGLNPGNAGGKIDQPRISSTLVNNSISSNLLSLGNLTTSFLKLQMDLARTKAWSQMFQPFTRQVPNGDDIGFSKNRTIWTGDGNNTYKEKDTVGLSISGKVVVKQTNQKKIRLNGLNINYGIETKAANSLADKVSIYQGNVDLDSGVPTLIYSDEVNLSKEQNTNNFIFAQGDMKNTVRSRVLIFITATPKERTSSEETPAEEISNGNGLSQEKVKALPVGETSSILNILNSAKAISTPGTFSDAFGQRVSFVFSEDMLTQRNFNKKVRVGIKVLNSSDKEQFSSITDIQSIALGAFTIPPLNVEKTCAAENSNCEIIQYLVTIETDNRLLSNKDIKAKTVLLIQQVPESGEVESKILTETEANQILSETKKSEKSPCRFFCGNEGH
jgi:hypothetical protein